jgi:hypothetical protein
MQILGIKKFGEKEGQEWERSKMFIEVWRNFMERERYGRRLGKE